MFPDLISFVKMSSIALKLSKSLKHVKSECDKKRRKKNQDVIFYLSRIKEQSEGESEDDILTQSLPNPNFRLKKYHCLAEDLPTSHTCFPFVDTLYGAATISGLLKIIGLFCKRAV